MDDLPLRLWAAQCEDPSPWWDVAVAVRPEHAAIMGAISFTSDRIVHADGGVLFLYEELSAGQLTELTSAVAVGIPKEDYVAFWRDGSLKWGTGGKWIDNPFDLAVRLSFVFMNQDTGEDDEY